MENTLIGKKNLDLPVAMTNNHFHFDSFFSPSMLLSVLQNIPYGTTLGMNCN